MHIQWWRFWSRRSRTDWAHSYCKFFVSRCFSCAAALKNWMFSSGEWLPRCSLGIFWTEALQRYLVPVLQCDLDSISVSRSQKLPKEGLFAEFLETWVIMSHNVAGFIDLAPCNRTSPCVLQLNAGHWRMTFCPKWMQLNKSRLRLGDWCYYYLLFFYLCSRDGNCFSSYFLIFEHEGAKTRRRKKGKRWKKWRSML